MYGQYSAPRPCPSTLALAVDPQDAAWQRALRRASARYDEAAPEVRAVARDERREGEPIMTYWIAVPSHGGGPEHRVAYWPAEARYQCDCEAAAAGRPCWHAALVWLWLGPWSPVRPLQLRIALRSLADPAAIARQRARLAAVLASQGRVLA